MERRHSVHEIVLLVAAAFVVAAGCVQTPAREPEPAQKTVYNPFRGKIIQKVMVFDNPKSAVFSADGKYVFISNAAALATESHGVRWTEYGGFVSKLEVQRDGTLAIVDPELIQGLTGPLGMAVSTKATKTFPAGTIFVCTGDLPIAEANGTPVTDWTRFRCEIVGFDLNGNPLGAINWGKDSELAKISGAPAAQPSGMAFDKDGNLYVAETGAGGDTLSPPLQTKPGVMMIPFGAIDDLAAGKSPAAKPLFIPIPGGPSGVAVCPTDQTIHVNTIGSAAGMKDPANGGMFELYRDGFAKGQCPPAFASGLGALEGLAFLPDGTRLDTQVLNEPNCILATQAGKDPVPVDIEPPVPLSSCAHIALRPLPGGSCLLIVPQFSPSSPNVSRDEVTVMKLPKDFGTMPPEEPEAATTPAQAK